MQQGSVASAVLVLPDIRKLMIPVKDKDGKVLVEPIPPDQLRSTVDMYVPMTVSEAVRDYDFDFACDYTQTTSTINDPTYVLKGRTDDCAYVVNVRYGSDEKLLDQYNDTDMDGILSGLSSGSGGVEAWYLSRLVNNFPEITLVSTPTATGDVIKYRYVKKNVSELNWPEEFGKVLIFGVAAMLAPNYQALYERGLQRMAKFYGKQKNRAYPPLLSKEQTNRNIERSQMMGYGGSY